MNLPVAITKQTTPRQQKKKQKEGKGIIFNNSDMEREFSVGKKKNGTNLKELTNRGDVHVTENISYRNQKGSDRDDAENEARHKRNQKPRKISLVTACQTLVILGMANTGGFRNQTPECLETMDCTELGKVCSPGQMHRKSIF